MDEIKFFISLFAVGIISIALLGNLQSFVYASTRSVANNETIATTVAVPITLTYVPNPSTTLVVTNGTLGMQLNLSGNYTLTGKTFNLTTWATTTGGTAATERPLSAIISWPCSPRRTGRGPSRPSGRAPSGASARKHRR